MAKYYIRFNIEPVTFAQKEEYFFWMFEFYAIIFATVLLIPVNRILIKKGRGSWPNEALATHIIHSVM
jgi:hypothetical protein